MTIIKINPKDLHFSLKAREMCKSCKRYNEKATCPPHVESVEYYQKLLPTYTHGLLYYEKFDKSDDWVQQGKDSSLTIHNALLKKRDELFNAGVYFINIFGAGSCKICDKCAFPCRFPAKSIIPLEGTGVNVVELMAKYGIKVSFPITDTLYRIGVVLYD